ncbi:MAG: response regulator, partial [Pedobacter sp.]
MASVLIIEDDSTFAQIIEGFLTKNNFEVTTVSNVAKALKLIAHEEFQLLLIDYRLPDGTGIDVLNHRREAGLNVPAIIMTS